MSEISTRDQLIELLDLAREGRTADIWADICDRLLDEAEVAPAAKEIKTAVGRSMARATFLLKGSREDRERRGNLLARLDLDLLVPLLEDRDARLRIAGLLAVGALTASVYFALTRSLPLTQGAVVDVARRLVSAHAEGFVTADELLTFAYRNRWNRAACDRIAQALADRGDREAGIELSKIVALADPFAPGVEPDWILEGRLGPYRIDGSGEEIGELEDAACARSTNPVIGAVRRRSRMASTLGLKAARRLAEHAERTGFSVEAARLSAPYATQAQLVRRMWARSRSRHRPAEKRLEAWRAALAIHRDPHIVPQMAAALADMLRYDEGWMLIEQLLATHRKRSGVQRNAILYRERIGDLGAALSRARMLHARFPDDHRIALDVQRLAFETGILPPQAQVPPPLSDDRDVPHRRFQAMQFLIDGQNEQSAELWSEISRFTGTADDAHASLNAQFVTGRFRDATALAEGLLRRFPGDHRFQLKLGQVAERLGDYEKALHHYTEGLRLHPEDQGVRAGLARSLVYLDRHGEAARWLAACRTSDDQSLWADSMRAFQAYRRTDLAGAREALERVYASGRFHLREHFAGRARDPHFVYAIDGHHMRHPLEMAAHSGDTFDRFIHHVRGSARTTLIGNAPSIIGSGKGRQINESDCVIRLNDFRINGFEDDLGTRTDYWYTSANRQAQPHLESVRHATTILTQPHALHLPDINTFVKGRLRLDLSGRPVCYLAPWIHIGTTCLAYPKPSTGFRMILMLEFLLQAKFSAMGFDFFSSNQIHYFDEGSDRLQIGEVHAIDFERDFVKMLSEVGRYYTVG